MLNRIPNFYFRAFTCTITRRAYTIKRNKSECMIPIVYMMCSELGIFIRLVLSSILTLKEREPAYMMSLSFGKEYQCLQFLTKYIYTQNESRSFLSTFVHISITHGPCMSQGSFIISNRCIIQVAPGHSVYINLKCANCTRIILYLVTHVDMSLHIAP